MILKARHIGCVAALLSLSAGSLLLARPAKAYVTNSWLTNCYSSNQSSNLTECLRESTSLPKPAHLRAQHFLEGQPMLSNPDSKTLYSGFPNSNAT